MNNTKCRFLTMAVFLVVSLVLVLGAGLISQAKASSVIFDYENGVLDSGAGTFTFDILVGDIGTLDNLDLWNLEFSITRLTDPGVPFSFDADLGAEDNANYVFFGNSDDYAFNISGGPSSYDVFAGDLTEDGLGNPNPEGLTLATLILDDVEFCDWFTITLDEANSFFGDTDLDLEVLASGPYEVHVVPIPGALWLLGSGLVCLIGLRRRNQKH